MSTECNRCERLLSKVGLHQGSAPSPLLFAIVMDKLIDRVIRKAAKKVILADDIVLFSEIREDVEIQVDRWCTALKRRGMKISRTKTENLSLNRDQDDKIEAGDAEIPKVSDFKYLGSTIQGNGNFDREKS